MFDSTSKAEERARTAREDEWGEVRSLPAPTNVGTVSTHRNRPSEPVQLHGPKPQREPTARHSTGVERPDQTAPWFVTESVRTCAPTKATAEVAGPDVRDGDRDEQGGARDQDPIAYSMSLWSADTLGRRRPSYEAANDDGAEPSTEPLERAPARPDPVTADALAEVSAPRPSERAEQAPSGGDASTPSTPEAPAARTDAPTEAEATVATCHTSVEGDMLACHAAPESDMAECQLKPTEAGEHDRTRDAAARVPEPDAVPSSEQEPREPASDAMLAAPQPEPESPSEPEIDELPGNASDSAPESAPAHPSEPVANEPPEPATDYSGSLFERPRQATTESGAANQQQAAAESPSSGGLFDLSRAQPLPSPKPEVERPTEASDDSLEAAADALKAAADGRLETTDNEANAAGEAPEEDGERESVRPSARENRAHTGPQRATTDKPRAPKSAEARRRSSAPKERERSARRQPRNWDESDFERQFEQELQRRQKRKRVGSAVLMSGIAAAVAFMFWGTGDPGAGEELRADASEVPGQATSRAAETTPSKPASNDPAATHTGGKAQVTVTQVRVADGATPHVTPRPTRETDSTEPASDVEPTQHLASKDTAAGGSSHPHGAATRADDEKREGSGGATAAARDANNRIPSAVTDKAVETHASRAVANSTGSKKLPAADPTRRPTASLAKQQPGVHNLGGDKHDNPNVAAMRLVKQGQAQVQSGQLDLAEASYREAVRLAPSRAQTRLGLARVVLRRGKSREAVRLARQLVDDRPYSGPAYLVLGDAHASLNRMGAARRAWRKGARLGNAGARKRLSRTRR